MTEYSKIKRQGLLKSTSCNLRINSVGIPLRAKYTALFESYPATAPPTATSAGFNPSKKRVSIDLTLSDNEEDQYARPPVKQRKTTHSSSASSREASTFRASGIEVVVPKRSQPTIVSISDPIWNSHHQEPLESYTHSQTAKYATRLSEIQGPPVTIFNHIDTTTPPQDFTFINEYVFREGTKRLDSEFRIGCTCYQAGSNAGCSLLSCECLDDTAIGENGKSDGFAYHGTGPKTGLLRQKYLNTRNPIYECNELCSCGDSCKSRVVQKGRQIPLEIFKTRHRGWGLRSPQSLRKGQFIDTYLGEVITDAEASRREGNGIRKDSYLYSLDKHQGIEGEFDYIPSEELYVVDGEFMGGPTRFINHSCDPNCRQFTVSNVRGDNKVYALAFFALKDIPAWDELTFDYLDKDEDDSDEEEEVNDTNVEKKEKERDKLATKCLCGSSNCRKYLWL
ncbi:hypothetical protein MMC13_004665 [Lambiella insularis]|nr:hypothetical protein [Lambiella insularis]